MNFKNKETGYLVHKIKAILKQKIIQKATK